MNAKPSLHISDLAPGAKIRLRYMYEGKARVVLGTVTAVDGATITLRPFGFTHVLSVHSSVIVSMRDVTGSGVELARLAIEAAHAARKASAT